MFWFTTFLLKITYQQTLFYSAFTETTLTNSENWSFIGIDPLNVISQCGPYSVVGGFEKFGIGIAAIIKYDCIVFLLDFIQIQLQINQNYSLINFTINNTKFLQLPPHYQMKISFTLLIIDTWDANEYCNLYVDENIVFNQAYSSIQSQSNMCGQTGNYRQDSIHDIQIEFQHTGTTAFIQLTSTLDAIPFDESWGFRNFRLFLYLCPSGCLICSQSNSQTECQTWIIISSFYTEIQYDSFSTDGWSILNGDQTKQQCSMIPSICGYGVCGKDTQLTLTLVSLPFHTRMKIKFKYKYINPILLYLKIDRWENSDYAILKVNHKLRWKQSLQFYILLFLQQDQLNIYMECVEDLLKTFLSMQNLPFQISQHFLLSQFLIHWTKTVLMNHLEQEISKFLFNNQYVEILQIQQLQIVILLYY